jgi:hypothetical protein
MRENSVYVEDGLKKNVEKYDSSLREKMNRSSILKDHSRFPTLITSINAMSPSMVGTASVITATSN